MKTIFTAICGGIVGAAMVLMAQNIELVKPAQAYGAHPGKTKCMMKYIEDIHADSVLSLVADYCDL
jgi:hypothetical protein